MPSLLALPPTNASSKKMCAIGRCFQWMLFTKMSPSILTLEFIVFVVNFFGGLYIFHGHPPCTLIFVQTQNWFQELHHLLLCLMPHCGTNKHLWYSVVWLTVNVIVTFGLSVYWILSLQLINGFQNILKHNANVRFWMLLIHFIWRTDRLTSSGWSWRRLFIMTHGSMNNPEYIGAMNSCSVVALRSFRGLHMCLVIQYCENIQNSHTQA